MSASANIRSTMDNTRETEASVEYDSSSSSQIVKFFEGRSIFITGGTGYVGMVLIEKILFTCKSIKNVYVLIKQKGSEPIETRLLEMFNSPAFHRIKKQCPDSTNKIIPIGGNIMEDNLGISESNIRLLKNEVSVVFHVAARISFSMDLAVSININTKATEKLIGICKDMPHLTAFIYVSTGYSQSNRTIIDEEIYETTVTLEKIYELIDIPGSERIAMNLLENRPNTYSYSKALTEEVIRRNADQIPVAIVRPTQILSAVKEPLPGWITSWAGPSPIVEAATRGLWLCWHSDPDTVIDLVPVDYVANCIIAAAWDTHNRRIKGEIKKEKKAKVFNYSSGVQNPIDTKNYISICLDQNRKTKNSLFTNRFFIVTRNYFIYWIVSTLFRFFYTIFFIMIDAVMGLFGGSRRMVKLHGHLAKIASIFQVFTRHQILFLNGNVRRLYESLNETDKTLFDFDISNVQWDSYFRDYVVGMKEYNPKLF